MTIWRTSEVQAVALPSEQLAAFTEAQLQARSGRDLPSSRFVGLPIARRRPCRWQVGQPTRLCRPKPKNAGKRKACISLLCNLTAVLVVDLDGPMRPQKHLSKSKLSMFLRTGCDRELYLSLHTDAVLADAGPLVPLKARPGIGVLKKAGNDFEEAKNAELMSAFPGLVLRPQASQPKRTRHLPNRPRRPAASRHLSRWRHCAPRSSQFRP
jgi:hypothetical protein